MVLGAITVLTVFLTELQEETSSELSAALAERDALRAEYYARSAVNLSRLVIASSPQIQQTVGPILQMVSGSKAPPQIPVWNFVDTLLAPFNDKESAASFGGTTGLDLSTGKNLGLTGGGHFELKIVDEEAKINLNMGSSGNIDVGSQLRLATQLMGLLAPPQYNPLFERRDADNQFSDRQIICGAIVDWTDYDESLFPCDVAANAGPASGVEDNFYQMIGLPYRRKNAAFDSLDELRLVRGMGDDFWATFIDPDPTRPEKRPVTVWGKKQSTVNLNSANAQTLLAVVCGAAPDAQVCVNPDQMSRFLMGVNLARSFLQGIPIFGSPKDFLALIQGKGMFGAMLTQFGVQPVTTIKDPKGFLKSLSTESKFLSIYADGVVPGNKRETRVRIHAVVDFSGAGALTQASSNPLMQLAAKATGTTATNGMMQSPYEQSVRVNPAGVIVYYRIE